MNSEDGCFLEVCNDADPESADPAEVQPNDVDFDRPLADLVADKELVDLLVPDVDNDAHQQGPDVKELREYARL